MYIVSYFTEWIQMLRIVTSDTCITQDDGKIIYGCILDPLQHNDDVILDFSKTKIVAAPFLNAAIGQLYKHVHAEVIENHLKVHGLEPQFNRVVNLIKKNSQRYYNDIKYRRSLDSVMKRISENGLDIY